MFAVTSMASTHASLLEHENGEQYGQGAAGITRLLTSQMGLTTTRNRNVAIHYDYLIALSDLKRARGDLAGGHVKPAPGGPGAGARGNAETTEASHE